MRITGKYDGWETETFVMQLSPKDLNVLHSLLKRHATETEQWDVTQRRFLEMLLETEETEFGFERYTTKEY